MLKKISTVFYTVMMFILASQFAWGASGKIQGKVTDAITGEALIGANVILKGTSMGAASNLNGQYLITGVPEDSYTMEVSYIGYKSVTFTVKVSGGKTLEQNIRMQPVSVSSKEVVVTAQASGQNAAINQQLSSNNIVNVVSSARIQQLPDANAAESIGRLPGVSLIRSGGEATQVVIRGLAPEFNRITINGVPIPSNESSSSGAAVGGGRGTDMRMVSSDMLSQIQVFKTNTPDMDAAVLGGTVNLGIRKARKNITERPLGLAYMPAVSLRVQGGYTDLTNQYNNYKVDLTLEKRYFNQRFGVLVQGIVQQQNLNSDRLDVSYTQLEKANNPDRLGLTGINLYFYPRTENTYNGIVTLDYNIHNGSLVLTNILSKSKIDENHYEQHYGIGQRGGNSFSTYAGMEPRTLNLITNILTYKQKTDLVDIDATLSHSYTENVEPDTWYLIFDQLNAGTNGINIEGNPVQIASQARSHMILDQTKLRNVSTTSNFTKQRELRGSVDFKKDFNISDLLSVELKAGGMYEYSTRYHNHEDGYGWIYFGQLGQNIVNAMPWLVTQWGIDPNTASRFPIQPFLTNVNFGTFLNKNYNFDYKLNLNLINRIKELAVAYGKTFKSNPTGGNPSWVPNMFNRLANDYWGNERRSAGYLMGTFNISQMVTVIAGARYQNLTTEYTGYRCYTAGQTNTFPNPYPGLYDTTFTETHGYWLPDVNLNFKPLSWLSLRASYTNTLAYPNYEAIIPQLQVNVGGGSVIWNNVGLKPARSSNVDLQLSIYNNALGLFTFGGYLKQINDFVFKDTRYIVDPNNYDGLHDVPSKPGLNVKGYQITTFYNNPNKVKLWGLELDWQTHFWYLPGVLSGLVLNANYTHIFSQAKYPHTTVSSSGFPPVTTYNDTTYTDALIDQPDNAGNISLGWDYKDFSILVSMIYQSSVYHNTNFYNSLRVNKDKYIRFDLVANQKLPWYNIGVFLNLNNLNGANDTYIQRGNSFPQSDYSYGLTAQLGLKVNIL